MASLLSAKEIQDRCEAAGFSGVGSCPIQAAQSFDAYQAWIDQSFHGTMAYLADHRKALRENIQKVFPEAKSLVLVTWPYSAPPQSGSAIAAYAYQSEDYHHAIRSRLRAVVLALQNKHPEFQAWVFADTHPILERDYAVQAGLGWMGKNTCLIDRARGSFFTIGGMALNVALDKYSTPNAKSYCGTCQRCIDQCPTQAFVAPYQLDAKRCISYLTIEFRGVIPNQFFKALKGHFFGCDICQSVCPWNKKWVKESEAQVHFDAMEWLHLSAKGFKKKVHGSALERMRFDMMQRNALIQLVHQVGYRQAELEVEKLQTKTQLLMDQLKELKALLHNQA